VLKIQSMISNLGDVAVEERQQNRKRNLDELKESNRTTAVSSLLSPHRLVAEASRRISPTASYLIESVFKDVCGVEAQRMATYPHLRTALTRLGAAKDINGEFFLLKEHSWLETTYSIDFRTFASLVAPLFTENQGAIVFPLDALPKRRRSEPSEPRVFLGGACNPTSWRKDIAMPVLEANGITFYNPQVDEWSPSLVPLERKMKENASLLLFVISSQTRGIASMIEAAELIALRRKVILVVEPLNPGHDFLYTPEEVKDLNRGRSYLLEIANKYNETCKAFENLQDALQALLEVLLIDDSNLKDLKSSSVTTN